jgi:hypothetical protein
MAKAPKFTPFPVPVAAEDVPLVTAEGDRYRCTGCGGGVPAGAWLFETVEHNMVTGLVAKEGPDGPVVHDCGAKYPHPLPMSSGFNVTGPGW